MFISFCGHDGCGKTTQSQILVDTLIKNNYLVKTIPGYRPSVHHSKIKDYCNSNGIQMDSIISEELKSLILIYDLWHNVKMHIMPTIDAGNIIITERYYESSYIYAPIFGFDDFFMNHLLTIFPKPDLYIYLDLSPDQSYMRVSERIVEDNSLAAKENIDIMRVVHQKFMDFLNEFSFDYIYIAVHNKSREEISTEIWDKLKLRIK